MSQTEKLRLRAASPTLGPSVSPGSILLQVPGQGTLHRTNAPSPPHPLPEGPEPPRAQAWGRQVFQAPLPPHVPICPGSSACTPTRPSAPCATTWASAAPPPGPSHRPSAGHQTPSSTRAQNFHCPHPPEETALGLIGHSSAPASLQAPGHTLFLPPGPLPPSPQPPPASGPLHVPSPPRSSPSARSHLNVPLLTHHPSPTMPCSTGSTCRVCRGTSCAPTLSTCRRACPTAQASSTPTGRWVQCCRRPSARLPPSPSSSSHLEREGPRRTGQKGGHADGAPKRNFLVRQQRVRKGCADSDAAECGCAPEAWGREGERKGLGAQPRACGCSHPKATKRARVPCLEGRVLRGQHWQGRPGAGADLGGPRP